MDFTFAPEDEVFRQEIKEFVRREWDPKDYNTDLNVFGYDFDSADYRADAKAFQKEARREGLLDDGVAGGVWRAGRALGAAGHLRR